MRTHLSGVCFGRQEPCKFGAKGANVMGVGSQKSRSAYPTYREVGKNGSRPSSRTLATILRPWQRQGNNRTLMSRCGWCRWGAGRSWVRRWSPAGPRN